MAKIMKTMRTYGATTLTASTQELEQFELKPLGDVISWELRINFTTTTGTGTYTADGGTPSGAYRGSNWTDFFDRFTIKDKGNVDVFDAQRDDLWVFTYALSCVDFDDFLFQRGQNPYIARTGVAAVDTPVQTDTAAVTSSQRVLVVPQRIKLSDLPCKVNIRIGVLDDYFATVGTATAAINALEFVARYIAPDGKALTERIKAYNQTSFTADTDISSNLPDGINIALLGWANGVYTDASAPAELNEDRVDAITFRRGSTEEIEALDERNLHQIINVARNTGRPLGHYNVPTDAFQKTHATFWFFDINAAVAPRIYYVYTT